MKRYDRTWPVAVGAIGMGLLIGHAVLPTVARTLTGTHSEVAQPAPEPAPVVRSVEVAPTPAIRSAEPPREIRLSELVEYELGDVLRVLRYGEVAADRRNAATLLGSSTEPRRVLGALMISLRTDESAEVRFMSAASLGRIGLPAALGPLHLAATVDSDERVREAAVAALRLLDRHESVPVLLEVLETDRSEDVRAQALTSILRIGGEPTVNLVMLVMEYETSPKVRAALLHELKRGQDGR